MGNEGLPGQDNEGGRPRPRMVWAAAAAVLTMAVVAGVAGGVLATTAQPDTPAASPPATAAAVTPISAAPQTTGTVPQETTTSQPTPATTTPSTTAPATTTPPSSPTTPPNSPTTQSTQPATETSAVPTTRDGGGTTPSGDASGTLRLGDRGPAVERLQADLQSLGFRPGPAIDGDFGPSTASAVLAFQKFEGINRDGIAGPQVLDHLANPTGHAPRWTGSGPHIEVDLARQIVFAWTGDGQPAILNASTGSGGTYLGAGGVEARATTPTGDFVIERRIDGVRESYLGLLYRPLYFHNGYAIHGSGSVPAQPASHGCVRVSNADQDWLFADFSDGTSVSIA